MKTIRIKDIPPNPNPHRVETIKFHENEHVQAVHITLKPGERLRKHITAVDVFFNVLEGTGVVEIGDEKRTVTQDIYVDSPAKVPHCWYNESDAVLRVLVVKTPKPTTGATIL